MKNLGTLRYLLPILIVLSALIFGIFIKWYSKILYPGTSICISDETIESLKYYNIFNANVKLSKDFKKFLSYNWERMGINKSKRSKKLILEIEYINIDKYRSIFNRLLNKELGAIFEKKRHEKVLKTILTYSEISLFLFWIIVCFAFKYRETLKRKK